LARRKVTAERAKYVQDEHASAAQLSREEVMGSLPRDLILSQHFHLHLDTNQQNQTSQHNLPKDIYHFFIEIIIPNSKESASQLFFLGKLFDQMWIDRSGYTTLPLPMFDKPMNNFERTPPPEMTSLLRESPTIPRKLCEALTIKNLIIYDHRDGEPLASIPIVAPHCIYRLAKYVRRSLMYPCGAAKYVILIRMNRG
jgi:hypothetical protein